MTFKDDNPKSIDLVLLTPEPASLEASSDPHSLLLTQAVERSGTTASTVDHGLAIVID